MKDLTFSMISTHLENKKNNYITFITLYYIPFRNYHLTFTIEIFFAINNTNDINSNGNTRWDILHIGSFTQLGLAITFE